MVLNRISDHEEGSWLTPAPQTLMLQAVRVKNARYLGFQNSYSVKGWRSVQGSLPICLVGTHHLAHAYLEPIFQSEHTGKCSAVPRV